MAHPDLRDRPVVVLTGHFFTSLFDGGVLSDAGVDSLKRALLGSLAVALALGLLLTRVFMAKYGALTAAGPEVYAREVIADHAFLIAVAMWIVAGAIALAGESLFPDQTDFRILMAEPLSRPLIFGAKLAALLLFAGLFIGGAHLALAPLAALTLIGASQSGSVLAAAIAFAASSLAASVFAALAIVAVHGSLVLWAPRARLLAISGAVRSAVIGVLVLGLPLLARLPASARSFARDAAWLAWAPPAWFAGLERWLLGDGSRALLAVEAALATLLAAALAMFSYVLLYRRFDRVTFQLASNGSSTSRKRSLRAWKGRAPVRAAVRRFAWLTIRRSVLHQGLIVGLLAAAAGLPLGRLSSAGAWHAVADGRAVETLASALLWAPMTMMFLGVPAVRLALSVPLDLRANWIFRMAEDVEGRREVSAASVQVVLVCAVALPITLVAPLQWRVMGPALGSVLAVEAAIGWLLVECLMAGWRRVPFTCSYVPGKSFVPHLVVKAFASYLVFTIATGLVLRASIASPGVAVVAVSCLGAAAALLGLRRSRRARESGLLFEDDVPSDVTPLRLNAD